MPFGELIEQHRVGLTLVTLHRERIAPGTISGIVRHFSKRLILLEVVNDAGRGDGFTLIRREDLTRIDRDTEALRRILRAAGSIARNHPVARELDLLDWSRAITSAQRVADNLRLHREGVGDPIVLASRSIQLGKHVVSGERPDSTPADEGEVALAIDHLTRIDFA